MSEQERVLDPGQWLPRYGDLLFRYLSARVANSSVAEDLLQETFLSALKGMDGFKGESSEKSWLFAIARNKMMDHFRRAARSREVMQVELTSQDRFFDEDGNWTREQVPGEWAGGAAELERKEVQQIILRCKEGLKQLQNQVFTLKYLEGMSADQICKVLDISSSNYWVLIHRARLQMRECVERKLT